jgi:hypothetical protein
MLTKFHPQSSFKKKFTVIFIWLIALGMLSFMINFIEKTEIAFVWFMLPLFIGIFTISGILLRCKIARWITLLIMYISLFIPLLAYIIRGQSLAIEIILLYLFGALLIIYVFSNEKAMDLFYIESNPSEHLVLILLALTLNMVYISIFRMG